MAHTSWAAIALGSNLGDRRQHLGDAVHRLESLLADLRVSSFRETEPVGVVSQPLFLNAAAVGLTEGNAFSLLDALQAIERDHHRQRPFPGAPRTLDLDLVLFGSDIIRHPDLTVPHPRFRERLFVLEPLAEIAAGMVDPVTGKTVNGLLEELRGRNGHDENKNRRG